MRKTVIKCVCHKITFAELKEIAERENIGTAQELIEADYCSNGCTMCQPYVEKMMATGETAFYPGDVYYD